MTLTEHAAGQSVSRDEHSRPVRRAAVPLAPAAASYIAVALAIAVMAVGVVALRDTAVAVGLLTGERWIPRVVHTVDGLAPASWMLPAGVVATVGGLLLVAVALLPRRRTAAELTGESAIYMGPNDIAHVATAVASDIPGVLRVRTTVSRRKVAVRCVIVGDAQQVEAAVADTVRAELGVLRRQPKITVRARSEARS